MVHWLTGLAYLVVGWESPEWAARLDYSRDPHYSTEPILRTNHVCNSCYERPRGGCDLLGLGELGSWEGSY